MGATRAANRGGVLEENCAGDWRQNLTKPYIQQKISEVVGAVLQKQEARVTGPENLSKPAIQKKISELVEAVLQEQEISVKRVMNEIAQIAFVDPAELFDEDGSLKKIGDLDPEVPPACGEPTLPSLALLDKTGDLDEKSTRDRMLRKGRAREFKPEGFYYLTVSKSLISASSD